MHEANDEYVEWSSSLHRVVYNSQVVILDELHNEFIFFTVEQSEFVKSIIGEKFEGLNDERRAHAEELLEQKILSLVNNSDVTSGFSDVKNSKGTFQCAWRSGSDAWSISAIRPLKLLRAIKYLKHAKEESEKGNLRGLLGHLREQAPSALMKNHERLIGLACNINLAVKMLNVEIKCLEFAYSLARMAFDEGLACRLNIGVQTFPFLSHAWIQGPNGVVFDRDDLEKDLAVMIRIGAEV